MNEAIKQMHGYISTFERNCRNMLSKGIRYAHWAVRSPWAIHGRFMFALAMAGTDLPPFGLNGITIRLCKGGYGQRLMKVTRGSAVFGGVRRILFSGPKEFGLIAVSGVGNAPVACTLRIIDNCAGMGVLNYITWIVRAGQLFAEYNG